MDDHDKRLAWAMVISLVAFFAFVYLAYDRGYGQGFCKGSGGVVIEANGGWYCRGPDGQVLEVER